MTKPHVVRVIWDVIVQADNKKEAEEIVKGKIPAMMSRTPMMTHESVVPVVSSPIRAL